MRASGRKRRSAWSDGVASTVSPIERRRTTSTRRTRDQSQRAGASGRGPSTPPASATPAECANGRGSVCLAVPFILDGRLFDDERGDVVADGVDATALGALDAARVLLQHDLPLTGRADDPERLDEIRRDWHPLSQVKDF